MKINVLLLVLFPLLLACTAKPAFPAEREIAPVAPSAAPVIPGLEGLPEPIAAAIAAGGGEFLSELEAVLAADTQDLLRLVDKQHSIGADYQPADLVPVVAGKSYVPNRNGLSLRAPAEQSLETMARAAREAGLTLVVSSTYRSYDYQAGVYARNVQQMGQAAADRESARPGTSQHQLGTAVDFGSITDDFAYTASGRWLAENAARFGWSLSFPDGYETITGYRWECWHYRFIGVEAAAFQKKWFGNIQQYMLEFIDRWLVEQTR